MSFFPSRYPIMCAVMNGVCDLNLALAVNAAGAMPSLLLNVRDGKHLALDEVDRTLKQYQIETGHTNLVLSINPEDILEPKFMDWLDQIRPSHIELLGYDMQSVRCYFDQRWPILIGRLRKFSKIMTRCIGPTIVPGWTDALCVKGRESAGFTSEFSVRSIVEHQLINTPDCAIIPYGGVGTAEHVKQYIDMGAAAVACGSLFAASRESRLNIKVKQKIVGAGLDDLETFPDTGQRALILGSRDSVINDTSNWNREHSLVAGIHGDGTVGHIYLGESVQHITSIRSVKEIVDDLVKLL